ncbi:MAG: hypothetical protein AB8H47_20530 [Bacteroidia bacterium]
MMKTLMITGALALSLVLTFAALPNARTLDTQGNPSCTSLFSRLTGVFDNVVREMAGFRAEAAAALVEGTIPIVDLEELTDEIKDAQILAYESVGEIVGDKGTPGPVNLTVPFKNFRGTCYAERSFHVMNGPWDQVHVSFKKTGGKNGADIAICKYDVNGNYITTKYAHIDKGSGSEGVEEIITLKGMQNEKYLTIHVVATGGPTNKIDYRLKVTGEFNEEKLADENPGTPPSVFKPNRSRAGN